MKQIAILHTVRSVIEPFEKRLLEAIPDVTVYNLLDEFLAIDANRRGMLTLENRERLELLTRAAVMTGADALVCTCSTLSRYMLVVSENIGIPVITIDGEMIREAVGRDGSLTILATAPSAVAPLRAGLERAAADAGRTLELSAYVCKEAFEALRAVGREEHDRLLLSYAREIEPGDVVLLAQASMAHMAQPLSRLFGRPVLSAPESCVRAVRELLEGGREHG